MDYFLLPSELYEAQAEYDTWLRETGNDPQTIFEDVIEKTDEHR